MNIWIEGRELVLATRWFMVVIGPVTFSVTATWHGRERGFLLHPGQSGWL
jgi:hypothetical protein